MARDDRLQVRISDELMGWLDDRANRYAAPSVDLQARAELDTWRGVLSAELRGLRGFTLDDVRRLADMVSTAGPLGAFDALRLAHGGGAWGREDRDLLQKLAELGAAADLALADALSRWRKQDLPATADGFDRVGIHVVEE